MAGCRKPSFARSVVTERFPLYEAARALVQATPACPSELTAPKLHGLLALEAVRGQWGAKGVGSQGDGTAQVIIVIVVMLMANDASSGMM